MGRCERSLGKHVAAAMLAVQGLILLTGCGAKTPITEATLVPEATAEAQIAQLPETVPTEAQAVFPMRLEDGRLEIGSLFQLDGINPDCENEEGENIVSALITNTSGEFLAEATVRAELSDGTQVDFFVTNLPAGKTAMVFSTDNATMTENALCAAVSCEARWLEEKAMPEAVSAVSDGMIITVTNNTDQNISELIIYCRCPFDEAYYGGISYPYTVKDIPAYGQATVEALDCIMGLAEVVRIAIG